MIPEILDKEIIILDRTSTNQQGIVLIVDTCRSGKDMNAGTTSPYS